MTHLDPKRLEAATDALLKLRWPSIDGKHDRKLDCDLVAEILDTAITAYLEAAEPASPWRFDIENAPTFHKQDAITRDHVFLLAYVDEQGRERTSEAGWCADWPYPRLVSDGQPIETGYAFYRYPEAPRQGA